MNKFPELKALPTQEEFDELKQRNAELEAQLVEVNNNKTGVAPCARFCEALAAKKMFDNLQRENAELMAMIERLRLAAINYQSEMSYSVQSDEEVKVHEMLHNAIAATPAQCLAEHDREVAARAVEKAINLCQHSFGSWENAITGSLGVANYELQEYANKIKSGEVKL